MKDPQGERLAKLTDEQLFMNLAMLYLGHENVISLGKYQLEVLKKHGWTLDEARAWQHRVVEAQKKALEEAGIQ